LPLLPPAAVAPDALHNRFVSALLAAAWANELPEDYMSYIPAPKPKRERPKLWVKTTEAPKKKRLVAPAQVKVEPVKAEAGTKKAEVSLKATQSNPSLVPVDLSVFPESGVENQVIQTPPSKN
jgi:hypothetical protein